MNRVMTGTQEKLLTILSRSVDAPLTSTDNLCHQLKTYAEQEAFFALIKKMFGIELTMEVITVQSSIQKLASFIEMVINMREDHKVKPVRRGAIRGELSHNQDRMYLFDSLGDNQMLYNMPFKFRLNGILEIEVLQKALDSLVERHESLRTNFLEENHQIRQVVNKFSRNTITYEDLRDDELEVAFVKLDNHLNKEARRSFHLDSGPLFTLKIFQIEDEFYYLVCNFHHIIFDGVSFMTFFQELTETYERNSTANATDTTLPLEMQYLDYALWHKEWVQENDANQKEFWERYFMEGETNLELPYDFSRPKSPSFSGSRIELEINNDLRVLIDRVLKQSGTTLYAFMLTAYQVFLAQYTGKQQIVVGSTVANRVQEEFAKVIGCFVNTLPFQLEVDSTESFQTILTRNRQQILEVLEYQAYPFDRIVDIINPDRDLSYSPLFQTAIAMEESFDGQFRNSFFTLEKENFDIPFSNYDLTIKVKGSQKLILEFEYSDELFLPETIKRLMKSFEKWLYQICQHFETPIRQLQYLDDDQLDLLSSWQGEITNDYANETVISVFKQVVKERATSIAVYDNGEQITFYELDKKSDGIAHLVKKAMGERSKKVGLHVTRSIDMVVSMLGIMKAGCAYVPLDPSLPSERLEYIIHDSALTVCITDQRQQGVIETIRHVINLTSVRYEKSAIDCSGLEPTDLAYIIYTSGTTGRPKGVMLSHKGIVNLVRSQHKYLHLKETSKVLQFATYNFDASVYEIFGSLLNGAELHIGNNKEDMFDLIQLEKQIKKEKLTHLVLPPAILQVLDIENGEVEFVGSAGSDCPVELVKKYQHVNFYNAYGPSEYSVWTTFEMFEASKVSNDYDETRRKVSIGKPILNTNVYLLNSEKQFVPIGATGELYIGGEGLAAGYHNNDELTKEKFIEHPFRPGERLYRSGDLAKYTMTGELLFQGRSDNQVKIRGFRVEMDEIVIKLNAHPLVSDAYIKIDENVNYVKQLIAYVTSNEQIDTEQIKAFLKESLPTYMIPSFVLQIDSFPLNANGKVDTNKLPDPATKTEKVVQTPDTENERILLTIFESVLGMDKLSIRDNFFELGGDSIQSIQICSLARQEGLTISPKSIFEHQTVAELAASLHTENKSIIQPLETRGSIELIPIQEWFFKEHSTSIHHWNQSLVFNSNECASKEELEQILAEIVDHHDVLLTLFQKKDEQYIGLINSEHKTWELIYKDVHHLDKDTRIRKRDEWEIAIQESLNIENGPIMKMLVLKEQAHQYRFFWVIHHLVVDAVSWRILLEDFHHLHDRVLNNQPTNLPPRTSSYKDWSIYLKKYIRSVLAQDTINYWTNKLNSNVSPFRLVDHMTEKREKTREIIFSEDDTTFFIQELTSQSKASVEEVLLTLVAKSMGQAFDVRRFWIEVEGHGREMVDDTIDITRTVGWFTTIYPILLESDSVFATTLKNTKNAIREIPNKGFDYGLIKYSTPVLIEDPDIYMTFNYLGRLDSQIEFSVSSDFGEFESKPRLHILAVIQNDRLHIKIISKAAEEQISLLVETIQSIIVELKDSDVVQNYLIESDFPDAVISEDDLLHILNSNN
ncbi:non-ribosomal peptide synthetase [Halalkalibacter alkalisediminis]|uniref:Non-ribosomal peptide synthetase n=1 Tax=Halalkalibacter alkalisediminis TaxID=935616 RepID=A0ABV6NQ68_9BACI|nr:non-ribosomal peptide synthetase [Halalkalibacter alkalisediminis]